MSVYAESKTHTHGGRSHTHPLPIQGIKHRHGNGAYGTTESGDKERKLTSSVISHPNQSAGHSPASDSYTPIDGTDTFELISGNTLISKNKIWCFDDNPKEACLKIAILQKAVKTSNSPLKNNATVIYPKARKVIKKDWGIFAVNIMYYGLHMGITEIPMNYTKSFKNYVSINQDKNILRIKNTNSSNKLTYYIHIKKGNQNSWIAEANKGNFKTVDISGKLSLGEAIGGAIIKNTAKALNSVASSNHPVAGYKPCHSGTCFETLGKTFSNNTYTKWKIKCFRGSNTGKEGKVCIDNDGDWSNSCTLGTYHYSSRKSAGNAFCNY